MKVEPYRMAAVMRETVGTDDWFAIPLRTRLRIFLAVTKLLSRGGGA